MKPVKFWFGAVLTFFFLLSSLSAQALALDDASHNKAVLKKLGLKKFENLKGHFVQKKVLAELGVEIKTEGQFKVSRKGPSGSIFHWDIEKPKVSSACIDSQGIVLISGKNKKQISFAQMGPDSGEQMTSLMKLISLDPEKLVEDFKVEGVGPDFVLSPVKPESVFFETAQIHVNQRGLVDQIRLFEKPHEGHQDELKIQFSSLQTDFPQKLEKCAL